MKTGWLVLALLLPTPMAPVAAQTSAGPSFDCARAKGVVEQAICGDPELAEADRTMARLFAATRTSAFGSGPSNMLVGQRRWLKEREDCAAFARQVYKSREDCLAGHYRTRNEELAVAALFAEPQLALATLRKLDPELAPLYEAVFVYASQPEGTDWAKPALGAERRRLLDLLAPQFALLQTDRMRSYGRSILGDSVPKLENVLIPDDNFGDTLRTLAAYADGKRTPMTIPCAAIVRRPGLWDATLAMFGSGLDVGIPTDDCDVTLPALPRLDLLVARINAGWPDCQGSIRFSAYRGFAAMVSAARLGDSVVPGYRSTPGARAKRLARVQPAAVSGAIAELAGHYRTYRHVDAATARAAANDAVFSIQNAGHECGGEED
jgi:uncharacterized protein